MVLLLLSLLLYSNCLVLSVLSISTHAATGIGVFTALKVAVRVDQSALPINPIVNEQGLNHLH
jgi:hypothetical protein